MTLSLFVGNAIKDLVCSPRPLGLAYGRQRLKFLAADSSDEEVQLNAKVGPCNPPPADASPLLTAHCGPSRRASLLYGLPVHPRLTAGTHCCRLHSCLHRSMACPPATPSTRSASTTLRSGEQSWGRRLPVLLALPTGRAFVAARLVPG